MFQVKYHMDMNLYRKWTCPPMHKVRGFWFWMALLAISTPALFYFKAHDSSIRLQSLASMGMLISVYRGILFRPMYANKQFRVMCIDYEKPQEGWDSRVDLDGDGICSYMDDKLLNHVGWNQVESVTVTTNYIDFTVAQDFIRLPRDSFQLGSSEELLAWLEEKHPEIQRKEETKEFAN